MKRALAFAWLYLKRPFLLPRVRKPELERPYARSPELGYESPEEAGIVRCLSHGFPTGRIGLYAEQPYTWWASGEPSEIPEPIADLLTSPLRWVRARAAPATLLRKAAACLAYRSQARGLGRVPILRTIASDAKRGGEAIAWLPGQA